VAIFLKTITLKHKKEQSMKQIIQAVIIFFLSICVHRDVQAQFVPITAKELYPSAESMAKATFASDAYLVNVLFSAIEYNGFKINFDLATGKATGWLYRFYSPILDSSYYLLAANVIILGPQIIPPPAGTTIPNAPVQGLLSFDEPWVDSPVALQGALNGGAQTFIQTHSDAEVQLVFSIENPIDQPLIPKGKYWIFTLHSAGSNESLTCAINAETGVSYQCGVLNSIDAQPDERYFIVGNLYPNPVSLTSVYNLTVPIQLTVTTKVLVNVYNQLGMVVYTIGSAQLTPGLHTMVVPRDAIKQPGVYFVSVVTEKTKTIKRYITYR